MAIHPIFFCGSACGLQHIVRHTRQFLDRLSAHIAEARRLLKSGEAIGRKLDLLTQEFVREANTLCSKSSSTALTRIGLELKAAIERLKEQSANVE